MRHRAPIFIILALILSFSLPCLAADQPVRHDFPPVGPYEVITGDFHIHTVNSDGRLTTRNRVQEAYQWGYDAIAITDHGRSVAYTVAKAEGDKLGMIVLRGFETGLARKEHLVVLNAPLDLKIRDAHNWAENPGEAKAFYQEQLTAIAEAGGIVIFAHPHVGYREPMLWAAKKGLIQGIELKNGVVGTGWNTVESHGTHWYPDAVNFGLEHDLAFIANSDMHGVRQPSNSPVTLLLVTERTPDAVVDAIRQRRTVAWFNGMLWGREKLLADLLAAAVTFTRSGDSIQIENHCPVALNLTVSDQKIELPAYGKASANGSARARSITVRWDNVWTGLKTNLQTEAVLKPQYRP